MERKEKALDTSTCSFGKPVMCRRENLSLFLSQLGELCTSSAPGTSPCFNRWRSARKPRAEVITEWRNKSNITHWLERWRNPQRGGAQLPHWRNLYRQTGRRDRIVKSKMRQVHAEQPGEVFVMEWWECDSSSIVLTQAALTDITSFEGHTQVSYLSVTPAYSMPSFISHPIL